MRSRAFPPQRRRRWRRRRDRPGIDVEPGTSGRPGGSVLHEPSLGGGGGRGQGPTRDVGRDRLRAEAPVILVVACQVGGDRASGHRRGRLVRSSRSAGRRVGGGRSRRQIVGEGESPTRFDPFATSPAIWAMPMCGVPIGRVSGTAASESCSERTGSARSGLTFARSAGLHRSYRRATNAATASSREPDEARAVSSSPMAPKMSSRALERRTQPCSATRSSAALRWSDAIPARRAAETNRATVTPSATLLLSHRLWSLRTAAMR